MSGHKVFLAYIPVIHKGYLNFFEKHADVKELWLLGEEFIQQYRQLVKDIRALSPEQIQISLQALELLENIEILTLSSIEVLKKKQVTFVVPDEEVTRDIVQKHFDQNEVIWDNIFLRWDKKRSESREEVHPDSQISHGQFEKQMINRAEEIGKKSSDWWRQVGAVITKHEKIIAESKNIHVPQDSQQYSDGDPRADYQSGEMFELSSSLHAESAVIAEAAQKGRALDGSTLYTSTFPCPVCAKLIAYSGIKKMYYKEGYSLLDGERVLKSKGVQIIKIS